MALTTRCIPVAGAPSCGGALALGIDSVYLKRLYQFPIDMNNRMAKNGTTFLASYLGSPGGLSGLTPQFTCKAATHQCTFLS